MKCRHCGFELNRKWDICQHCGKKISKEKNISRSKIKNNGSFYLELFFFILVFVNIFSFWGFLISFIIIIIGKIKTPENKIIKSIFWFYIISILLLLGLLLFI